MKTLSDTRPEMEIMQCNLLRDATPARKLAMVGQMNQTVITLAMTGLRLRFPDDSPELLHRRLADLILGEDLAIKIFGPLTEKY
jgi:hypothetical protein